MDYTVSEICPCRHCKERQPACHDNCDKYKEWKKVVQNVNNLERMKRQKYNFGFREKKRKGNDK